MISDMVLLKDIPETLKKSVLAYVGCVSGAEMKTSYIKMIENAGFPDVKVLEETHMPLDLVLSDATAKDLIKQLKLTKKTAAELVNSVVSIKVSARKPQN